MKPPFINVEEKIDRVVGKRTKTPDSWQAGMQLQALGVELHKAFKHRWMPKGVNRFKTHEEAAKHVVVREVDGVPISFASPQLLWRMKAVTHREKDAGDLVFPRQWFAERGEAPPSV